MSRLSCGGAVEIMVRRLIDGGLIIQTTELNQILEIGDGFVRVQAGALMSDINAQLKTTGWEMAMFPSTQKLATIGGFVALIRWDWRP